MTSGEETFTKTTVYTPQCPHCGKTGELVIPMSDVRGVIRWQSGMHIQSALPNWSAEMREQLKTGFHPDCWDETFSELEDDEGGEG